MSAIGDTQRLRWSLLCHDRLVDRWDVFAMDSLSDARFPERLQCVFNSQSFNREWLASLMSVANTGSKNHRFQRVVRPRKKAFAAVKSVNLP